MSGITQQEIEAAIATYTDPYLGTDLVQAKVVREIGVDGTRVRVRIEPGFPMRGYEEALRAALSQRIAAVAGVGEVEVNITPRIVSHAVQQGVKPIPQVKNIIAVASGKGGVGKSTTTANLALALAAEGATVGVLDADIYGPSQPRMLGAQTRPESRDGHSMEPVIAHGIQSMSIGYLIEEDTPMIWRGPMVTQALEQLLRETRWQGLDYLVIDLPPGTGDVQLTLAQRIPVSGAVIVTTPQDIALLDARKALKMFEKVRVPVLGVMENMSIHVCSQCGHQEAIFGEGGGERMAADYGVELLGRLPLDRRIRENADGGHPSVIADPEGAIAASYREIARRVAARLSLQAKDYSAKIPNIVIQQS
ncbi:MAG: iron-sulfur cluster carrier protein ApbC [Gammaproteobacteria bacterium]|jgi:ATP-binding protein involved in chromosome partitioning|nr:iron-sulfur cluster carrier protein ApbC [Gammaproteobacteria bacterium]